ncbi:MAG: hypothetical protein HOI53_04095 [Francisellaceae bacterium]|jgi:hypothetical protein|nr:hypothetical protein [Francisellaceae bacterium]MBT6207185.1 hypothetical protein [Francisellaceae bacterium]MBT6537862.1 hypothetical protein [Francisellaceae bacterium]
MTTIKQSTFENLIHLLKYSLTIIGKDKDILKPMYKSFYLATFNYSFIFITACVYFFSIGKANSIPTLFLILLFIYIFILLPYSIFYHVRMRACTSWTVYQTLTGSDISYQDAYNHTRKQASSLRWIAVIDIAMWFLTSSSDNGNNRNISGGFLSSIIKSIFAESWDLAKYYSIPTVVIEDTTVRGSVDKMKELKHNIPATLTGIFGIDFLGSMASMVSGFIITLPIMLIACGIGLFASNMFAPTTYFSSDGGEQMMVFGHYMSYIPLIFGAIVVAYTQRLLQLTINTYKIIYFTIFYTSLNRGDDIDESMRKDLTEYLNFKGDDLKNSGGWGDKIDSIYNIIKK